MRAGPAPVDMPRATPAEAKAAVRAATLSPEKVVDMSKDKTAHAAIAKKGAEQMQAGRGLEAMAMIGSGFTRTEWQNTANDVILTKVDTTGKRVESNAAEKTRA